MKEREFYHIGFKVETIIPNEQQRNNIHNIIYNELVKGIINDESRKIYIEIIEGLKRQGAEGIILGCTEIMLLINKSNNDSIIFDTTEVHALKAIEYDVIWGILIINLPILQKEVEILLEE